MKRLQRGRLDWMDIAFAGVLLAALIGFLMLAAVDAERRKEFMSACKEDGRKEYECIAMWRGGRR